MEATLRDGNLHEPAGRQLPHEETDEPPLPQAKEAEDRKGEPAKEPEDRAKGTTGTTEPTDTTDATGRTGRTPQPEKKEKRRIPVKAKDGKPSALCAGGRGVTHGGKEEEPGAERTGGGQMGEQDDRLPDTTRLSDAKPPLP